MIKRDGIELKGSVGGEKKDARNRNQSLAKETIQISQDGSYISPNAATIDIADSVAASILGTVYYPDPLPAVQTEPIVPVITVTNETTAQAAVRLASLDNLVALNFAAARNVGGGFLSGALAQEEDLCRCSALYLCLKTKPKFYNANILCENGLYTDGIIYSPKVPFFRNEYNLLIENPFELSIITAPAPNLNGIETVDRGELLFTLAGRAQKILRVAQAQGHKNIILGAWGCGAFGNDPAMVSAIFKAALKIVPAFENVCFAVYDTREGTPLYNTFKQTYE